MSIDYFKVSEKYKPEKVTTLLIAEAPPPSGKNYFYVPKPMNTNRSIENDTSLPATIFNHYFKKRPKSEEEYKQLLLTLQKQSIFLMDISDEPLKIREGYQIIQENLDRLIAEIPNLRDKIRSRGIDIPDEEINFLLPRKHYKKYLKEEFPNSRYYTWKEFRLNPE